MLFLLSPAKSLDYDSQLPPLAHTQPLFTRQSAALIDVLKRTMNIINNMPFLATSIIIVLKISKNTIKPVCIIIFTF